MKSTLFLLAAMTIASCTSPKQDSQVVSEAPPTPKSYEFLVGTYTDSPIEGINHLSFSPSENLLTCLLYTSDAADE